MSDIMDIYEAMNMLQFGFVVKTEMKIDDGVVYFQPDDYLYLSEEYMKLLPLLLFLDGYEGINSYLSELLEDKIEQHKDDLVKIMSMKESMFGKDLDKK